MNTAHPTLPPAQQKTLRRAIQIEWFTIGFLAVAITGVNLVMGSSQAMKAAWIEDLLSLAPPIAFLIAVRIITKPRPTRTPTGSSARSESRTSSPAWPSAPWAPSCSSIP